MTERWIVSAVNHYVHSYIQAFLLAYQLITPEATAGCSLNSFTKAQYLNAPFAMHAKNELVARTGAHRVLVIKEGARMLSNYREDRLVIWLSLSGRVASLSCT